MPPVSGVFFNVGRLVVYSTAMNAVSRTSEARDLPLESVSGADEGVLNAVIEEARASLEDRQAKDGHWIFELEADATIPSEYILLEHFLDEIDDEIEAKFANYLREGQGTHGGWPLYYDGDFNISASVKAYYALKLVGDDVDAPHMKRAREAILAHGGAAKCNVFTRVMLALFGQVPWRAVPVMPVEIMLLPRWFPFHLNKVSYWSRTVLVPLMVLMALKPQARNPRSTGIEELFVTPPEQEKNYLVNPMGSRIGDLFLLLNRVLRVVEPHMPRRSRVRSIEAAVEFFTERLNGEDGLGGIYPAMANAVMAFDTLGYAKDDPRVVTAKAAIKKLVVTYNGTGYCQPCMSPIWDTGLASLAMMEAGEAGGDQIVSKAADWMVEREITDVKGDWAVWRPDLKPSGWAFQYNNPHYPDVDDTAVVVMALDRAGKGRYSEVIERATEWVVGMQSKNGGWGAFDADNTYSYLNHIPFADHGALLDPPTADVTARCIGMLAQVGYKRDDDAVARGLAYLRKIQEDDGSWYGRWGTNYVYGTWSVLSAFNAADEDPQAPHIRKAVEFVKSRQREDGGWGEDGATYWEGRNAECKESTPSQTAWAVLGLMAAGEVDCDAVERGIQYLLEAPRAGNQWDEKWYTAVGFPRVFYLKYHGYSSYFPLWALSRYRNLKRGNAATTPFGM
jgi:squalene-hopene/tetraprenyl-beta-curcumene cyclase